MSVIRAVVGGLIVHFDYMDVRHSVSVLLLLLLFRCLIVHFDYMDVRRRKRIYLTCVPQTE